MRPDQNDIFQQTSSDVFFCNLITTSLRFGPTALMFDNKKALVQVMGRWQAITLTYLPLDKMAAISQTTFSDAFLWMKMFVF